MKNCKALIFPGEEDFGIVPVEAQCYGKPVIAYGTGGALETVKGIRAADESDHKNGYTGVFFEEQTVDSLIQAVHLFQRIKFNTEMIRDHALAFDRNVYKEKMKLFIHQKLNEWKASHAS